MSFSTTNGTRGARQPGGAIRLINKFVISRARRQGGKGSTLVLTTIGRKSGVKRETPVVWFAAANDSWLIVASAAGAAKNPAWYYNLAARPNDVQIEVAGRKVAVTADELHGDERKEAWQTITAASSRFAEYQKKTDRELPVIHLTAHNN